MSNDVLKTFLNIDKERQLLQSFCRIGLNSDKESSVDELPTNGRKSSSVLKRSQITRYRPTTSAISNPRHKTRNVKFCIVDNELTDRKTTISKLNNIEAQLRASRKKLGDELSQTRKKLRDNFSDHYTDKDRAASVSAGIFDIKESLQIKRKQERSESLPLVNDEADINSVIALGLKEIKKAKPENALQFFSQALELNCNDINALISRSKCFLLLGQASEALEDAERALSVEKDNIRAIFQKAESLYYLGQFEQSLMFFHRGLRARPELTDFRLGVQKTQEAIENTIGKSTQRPLTTARKKTQLSQQSGRSNSNSARNNIRSKSTTTVTTATSVTRNDLERRNNRKLLGKLYVDKEYLENLLKNPNLMRADTKTENISIHAKEAVDFLNKRQEFWRQQRPCTALTNLKNISQDTLTRLLQS